MKARYVLTVAGVSALGLFGVYGTSSAATSQSAPAPATRVCAIADGSAVAAGAVTGGLTVGTAVPVKTVPQIKLKTVKAAKAVPAGKATIVCSGHTVPGKGPVLTAPVGITLSGVPVTPAVPAVK
ncbi:MAG: hypothetical protein JWQ81_5631 [Amycolatopsis sp.]|jgi:hypothetical protein|uniref:hypothetical protein n=1 Tax=Amycolatopsis sp. TaxID=37632 RepID=UPI00260762BA|nr:hypothetical protein [Amycolatopsis sp.]MCU1684892.1 hypothetical protein [Amycolatopsis sp.]